MIARGRNAGFSLIEIMITLVVLSVALAAAGTLFNDLIGDFRQQTKISETGIETSIGLQLLKKDIENGGYGLPWDLGVLASYLEPAPASDSPNPPRAFSNVNSSSAPDRLVVRAVSVAGSEVSRKWTLLATGGTPRLWGDNREDPADTERVIVIRPGPAAGDARTLNVVSASGTPTFALAKADFAPPASTATYLVYGLDSSGARMPFNRADYYIDNGITSPPPVCAPGTGTLVKAVVSQVDGSFNPLPLLDCVLDMQVVFETNAGAFIDDLGANDAQWIRDNVRQVIVYVLAHEGRRDDRYVHDTLSITVGSPGRTVPLQATANRATDQSHYRWKLYTLAVQPTTLR